MKRNLISVLISGLLLISTSVSMAGEADVIDVKVQHRGGNSFQFFTTVQHADTGWKHYANAWEIVDLQGNVIATRTLHHPHVDEQPFTRSLRVSIPANIQQVVVRAVDSVHGTGGKTMTVILPR